MLGKKPQAMYTGKRTEQLICFQNEAGDPEFRHFSLFNSKLMS